MVKHKKLKLLYSRQSIKRTTLKRTEPFSTQFCNYQFFVINTCIKKTLKWTKVRFNREICDYHRQNKAAKQVDLIVLRESLVLHLYYCNLRTHHFLVSDEILLTKAKLFGMNCKQALINSFVLIFNFYLNIFYLQIIKKID